MKKINSLLLIAIVAITYLVSSCSNDEDNNPSNQGNEQLANEQNTTEETKIPTSTLETGIEIEGATKETGTLPSSNSNLNFDLNTDLTEAFQGSGLRIEFSSTESIAGAYIQFKDVDGNAASNYFDVSSSSFNRDNGRLARKAKPLKRSLSNARVAQNFNDQIEVDFGSNVPAGQFCYDICLYDASNNVSQIQTVCVAVEAWGGNASIVGEWIFERAEPADDDTETINCTNGQTIEVDFEQNIEEEITFTLNENGTYFHIFDVEGGIELDYSATVSNCTATYKDVEQVKDKYSGNWAYNEENQTLTIIDFKYEDLLDASNNEEYEDGLLFFEGVKAEVISGQLVLSETDDGETYKFYFNRK